MNTSSVRHALQSMTLLALLVAGCSSPSYYEMTLKQPNPYGVAAVRSAEKPRLDPQKNYRITDGKGGVHLVPSSLVAGIKAHDRKPAAAEKPPSRYYELALAVPNPYGVTLIRSVDKPKLDKEKNYKITDGRGGTFLVEGRYVRSIQSRAVKKSEVPRRVDNQPGTKENPNYINKFEFR